MLSWKDLDGSLPFFSRGGLRRILLSFGVYTSFKMEYKVQSNPLDTLIGSRLLTICPHARAPGTPKINMESSPRKPEQDKDRGILVYDKNCGAHNAELNRQENNNASVNSVSQPSVTKMGVCGCKRIFRCASSRSFSRSAYVILSQSSFTPLMPFGARRFPYSRRPLNFT